MHDDDGREKFAAWLRNEVSSGLTRRELFATLTRAGAAAVPLAYGLGAAAQTPSAPSNVRILGRPAIDDARPTITPGDLVFKGFVRFPEAPSDLWFSDPSITIRKVNGDTRVLLYGNGPDGSPVYEYSLTDSDPKPTLQSSPICRFVRNWGSITSGRTPTNGSGSRPGGLVWDSDRNALWWTYGDTYVPTESHPTLGCTILNDSKGTSESFGPWRMEWHSQQTRGALTTIPSSFAAAYTSGRNIGVMASQSSGNGASPFGAILSAMSLPDPTKTAVDVTRSSHWTVGNQGILLHDINHRMARDTRVKTCGWRQQYDCRGGSDVRPPNGLFGGGDPATGENDTMQACVWVDLPDKKGLLYVGQLATTPDGYSAPGDPDGLVHQWYGDPDRNDGSAKNTCCHGQDDPWWPGTGPGTHFRVPMGWIYNPSDLVATATGTANLWSRTPSSTFQWSALVPAINNRYGAPIWGMGAGFDRAARRIYLCLMKHDNITRAPHGRAVILVFDVK